MKCVQVFNETYFKEPEGISFAPYRVCPIGAHSDHNLGKITGFAIDKGIHMAYRTKHNGIIELRSLNFDMRAQWHIDSVPSKQNDWADYLRGATLKLKEKHPLHVGLAGVIEGTLPVGGLSSSAAVIICFLKALCKVNEITLSEQEMIDIAFDAEKNYVGVSIGKMDQSCIVFSRKDHLLYLDTKDNSYELIKPEKKIDYDILVFFSGLEHSLATSGFNVRVDELKAAAYSLAAYAGIEYGKYNDMVCRKVPYEVYEAYRDRLPENFRKRADHWYGEFKRVEKGAEAFRRGDLEEFGRLSFESGYSSIYNWEAGAPEQIRLYEIMKETEGIYGGRFSGAGFKGSCICISKPEYRDRIIEKVTREYLESYPEMKGKYEAFVCHSEDGTGK